MNFNSQRSISTEHRPLSRTKLQWTLTGRSSLCANKEGMVVKSRNVAFQLKAVESPSAGQSRPSEWSTIYRTGKVGVNNSRWIRSTYHSKCHFDADEELLGSFFYGRAFAVTLAKWTGNAIVETVTSVSQRISTRPDRIKAFQVPSQLLLGVPTDCQSPMCLNEWSQACMHHNCSLSGPFIYCAHLDWSTMPSICLEILNVNSSGWSVGPCEAGNGAECRVCTVIPWQQC